MWKFVPHAILSLLASSVFWTPPEGLIVSGRNTLNLNKNKPVFFALPFVMADCPPVGGQAVMDGVMMRNGPVYGLAVRMPDGSIHAQCLPWRVLTHRSWLKWPFIRGFPVLIETMVNGVQALNRSVILSESQSVAVEPVSPWQLFMGIAMALLMALGLFVIAPHLLSMLMLFFGLGGDVEGLSFHIWDGFYKCAIFILYIWLISFIPDIRKVFEYHGAEHKTIHAWETGESVSARFAWSHSRLHPRCGTTFLLFVICVSIILQALLVPLFLKVWTPSGMMGKHVLSVCYKLLLVAPISAISYELIKFTATLSPGPVATLLRSPGLFLQRLTTREPSREQLEVAVVALSEAVGQNWDVETVDYVHMFLQDKDILEK